MNRWMRAAVVMLALLSVAPVYAQRGGMRGGGGGVHVGGGGMRGGGAGRVGGGHVGFAAHSGGVSRGFVPFHSGFGGRGSGFGGHGGVRFRGAVGFGHNPRFHVGFGSGFRNGCFNGFCGGFGSAGFFGGVPIVGYPYPYAYPLQYADSYSEFQDASPYTVVQGENSYPAEVYEQGAMAQQVKDLSIEVERLRAELDARDSEPARAKAAANPKSTVQEVPLNAILVLRNGRKIEIHNYAIVGQTIWLLDEKIASKISIAQVNLPATKRVNEENGIMFLLPGMK